MTNRFLISVAAAALIASTGFANAQGAGGGAAGGGAAGGGSTMQQGGAPSERGAPSAAPMNRDSGPSGSPKGAQTERMDGGKNAQSDKMDGGKAKSAQDTDRAKGGKDMKAEGREGKDKSTVGQSREQSRDDRMAPGQDRDRTNAQDRDRTKGEDRDRAQQQGQDRDRMNADTKGGSQTTTTTGQAGAGAKLSTEQQTKISTVIKSQRVAPVTNVNFSISVGTRVPRDVHFHTLPAEVVTIYPQWRGYRFILVREEIVIIDPNTFEIVAVINA
jgi:hypothetical protein